jgi:hypothetical protein
MSEGDGERGQGQEHEELKVTDRRLFTAEGELREDGAAEEEPESSADTDETPRPESQGDDPGFEHHPVEEPTGVDFTMLINAMAEPALLFLGEIPHPSTGKPAVDLERARIQIDMLDLLRVKSRGNLTPEEEGLLDRMLYQLRMLFVSRADQPQA